MISVRIVVLLLYPETGPQSRYTNLYYHAYVWPVCLMLSLIPLFFNEYGPSNDDGYVVVLRCGVLWSVVVRLIYFVIKQKVLDSGGRRRRVVAGCIVCGADVYIFCGILHPVGNRTMATP